MVNPKNIAAIVKLATELERQSLEAQAADLGRAGFSRAHRPITDQGPPAGVGPAEDLQLFFR